MFTCAVLQLKVKGVDVKGAVCTHIYILLAQNHTSSDIGYMAGNDDGNEREG